MNVAQVLGTVNKCKNKIQEGSVVLLRTLTHKMKSHLNAGVTFEHMVKRIVCPKMTIPP